jgi:hypothetical protein
VDMGCPKSITGLMHNRFPIASSYCKGGGRLTIKNPVWLAGLGAILIWTDAET